LGDSKLSLLKRLTLGAARWSLESYSFAICLLHTDKVVKDLLIMSNDYSGAVPFFASIATLTSFESLVVLANRFRARKDAHRLVLADSLYFSWLG